ncbi:hypothetical protein KKF84_20510 [Myxococcota bacterium]|nr:hypothetical protein [Myxococcota bacterium]MBU1537708.1 hypothetical protein [Myxococcota bacterium]
MSHKPVFSISPVTRVRKPAYPELKMEEGSGRRFIKVASTLIFSGSMVLLGNSCFGTTDGGLMECLPGDLYCVSDTELSYCTDENGYNEYIQVTCDDYCESTVGPGSISVADCDAADTEDPCGCSAPTGKK